MTREPKLEYTLNQSEYNLLKELIGKRFWSFNCSRENLLVTNYDLQSGGLSLLSEGEGWLFFMDDNPIRKDGIVRKIKIKFPLIFGQDITYDLYSISLELEEIRFKSFSNPMNKRKYGLDGQGVTFGGVFVEKIELYNINNDNYIYESYDVRKKKDFNKIIDINIDLFLVFYFSNNSALFLEGNSSTGGCSLTFKRSSGNIQDFLKKSYQSNYGELGLNLKKVIT